jgi:hypothetical protein
VCTGQTCRKWRYWTPRHSIVTEYHSYFCHLGGTYGGKKSTRTVRWFATQSVILPLDFFWVVTRPVTCSLFILILVQELVFATQIVIGVAVFTFCHRISTVFIISILPPHLFARKKGEGLLSVPVRMHMSLASSLYYLNDQPIYTIVLQLARLVYTFPRAARLHGFLLLLLPFEKRTRLLACCCCCCCCCSCCSYVFIFGSTTVVCKQKMWSRVWCYMSKCIPTCCSTVRELHLQLLLPRLVDTWCRQQGS